MSSYFVIKNYAPKNAKKILFFFPAGFTKMWMYRWTIFLLNRMDIRVVGFDFAWKKAIRECGFEDFVSLIKQVDEVVDEVIEKNARDMQYSVLGLSFGSVLSLYTAKIHRQIKSIILFVPYGTLSHLLWTHKPSRPFIEGLVKAGLRSEKELETLTKPYETQHQLYKLKNRKVVSFLGENDKIVFDGQMLVNAIKAQGIEAKFYRTRVGHFGTSVLGILQHSKWIHII